MKRVIVITGATGTGKTTVSTYLKKAVSDSTDHYAHHPTEAAWGARWC